MRIINGEQVRDLEAVSKTLIEEIIRSHPELIDASLSKVMSVYEENKNDFPILTVSEQIKKNGIESVGGVCPGAVVGKNEREAREKLRTDFAAAHWQTILKNELIDNRFRLPSRHCYIFLNHELTEEAEVENKRFERIMNSGTDEEKRREVARKIEEFGKMDPSSLDFSDDGAFVKNYEKYHQFRLVSDVQNVVAVANSVGLDLSEPRFAQFCEKAKPLGSYMLPLGGKVKTLSQTMYSYVDIEKISPDDAQELSNAADENNSFENALNMQYSLRGDLTEESIRICSDNALSPAKKYAAVKEISNRDSALFTASRERLSHEQEAYDRLSEEEKRNYVKPDTLPADSPDRHFDNLYKHAAQVIAAHPYRDFRRNGTEGVAQILAVYRMQQEYNRLLAAGTAPEGEDFYRQYSFQRLYADKHLVLGEPEFKRIAGEIGENSYELLVCKDRAELKSLDETVKATAQRVQEEINGDKTAYYRSKVVANVDRIRASLPFNMTEAEIDAMVSPDKIEKHEIAKNLIRENDKKQMQAPIKAGTSFATSFSRMAFMLEKPENEPGAAEYNKELFTRLTDTSEEGDAFRRKTVLDILNAVNRLTVESVKNKSEDEVFNYAVRNYNISGIAFEIGNVVANLNSIGCALTPEAAEKFKNQLQYLTNLGTMAINVVDRYADEKSLFFPLEKVDIETAAAMANSDDAELKSASTECFKYITERDQYDAFLNSPSLAGQTYTEQDLIITEPDSTRCVSDCSDIRREYANFYRKLKDADHFYNRNNSAEYTELLKALEKTDKILAGFEGNMIPRDRQQTLRDALDEVNSRAAAYHDKKINEPQTANRAKRIAICKSITGYNRKFLNADEAGQMRTNGNYALDSKFMNFVRSSNAYTERKAQKAADEYSAEKAAPVNAKIAERERLFNSGLHKTEAERAKIQTLEPGTTAARAQTKAVEARDELTNLIGRSEIDRNKARRLMATVVCCDRINSLNKVRKNMTEDEIESIITRVCEDRAFIRLTNSLNSDKINVFLAEGGSEILTQRYMAATTPRQRTGEPENAPVIG